VAVGPPGSAARERGRVPSCRRRVCMSGVLQASESAGTHRISLALALRRRRSRGESRGSGASIGLQGGARRGFLGERAVVGLSRGRVLT